MLKSHGKDIFSRSFENVPRVRLAAGAPIAAVLGLIFLLSACASFSGARRGAPARHEFLDLPAGALAYIWIDVIPSRELLDDILNQNRLNTKTVKTFLGKTNTAVLALYPPGRSAAGSGERSFLLIGYGGNYPVFLSSVAMTFDPAWKKKKSPAGKKYWTSKKTRLSFFMQKEETYISDGELFFDRGDAEPPASFGVFNEGAQMAAWITDISPLNNALARMDIPVTIPADALFIAGFRHGEDWQAVFRMETPSPAQARGLLSMLLLLRKALDGNYIKDANAANFARFLLSESPELDGRAIILKSPPITRARLAGLTELLSVYLKKK
jgi:hypothetical protein